MKAIFKKEMNIYSNTVIGTVFISVFMIAATIYFYMYNIASESSSMLYLFQDMDVIMLVLIPLLTMRLMSEEKKNKTDQLLLTAPVSVPEIILGKYFAAVAIFGAALLITLIFPAAIVIFGKPAVGILVGSYIVFFLKGFVYIAIGLFISSLTENQIVSALLMFLVMVLFFIMDTLASVFPAIDPVISFISVNARVTEFYLGSFNFEHIIYYLSMIALFLFYSVKMVERRRYNK